MYLLDTHVLIWWLDTPEKLSARAYDLLYERQKPIYISPINSWEIMLKHAQGALPVAERFSLEMLKENFSFLPLMVEESFVYKNLPLHHHDPFDRMLIAQAMMHHLTLVTRDPLIQLYDIPLLIA